MSFEFVCDYKDNGALRPSLNRLASRVFGFSFKDWYSRGLWDDTYVCYSYLCDGEIAANVSASTMKLTLNGRECDAVQLGTVMTAPEHRKNGLSANLIRRIIDEYKSKSEFFYLFANDTVLDFYPRFGFKQCEEYLFVTERQAEMGGRGLRRLDLSDNADYRLLSTLSQERCPVSQALGVRNHGVFMFNCLYGFHDNIYYSDELAAAVIYTIGSNAIDIYDIISKDRVSVKDIIALLPAADNIRLRFTPDEREIYTVRPKGDAGDKLFILPGDTLASGCFTFPETSHT